MLMQVWKKFALGALHSLLSYSAVSSFRVVSFAVILTLFIAIPALLGYLVIVLPPNLRNTTTFINTPRTGPSSRLDDLIEYKLIFA